MIEIKVTCDVCSESVEFPRTLLSRDMDDVIRELIDMDWMLGNKDICPTCREKQWKQDAIDKRNAEQDARREIETH